jgi:hypothetical protein
MKTTLLLSLVAAGTLAATSLPAAAQTQPAGRKVDRNELRYCLNTADTFKSRNDSLKERAAKVRTEQEELKAEAEQLEEAYKRLEGPGASIGVATGTNRDRLERRKVAHERKAEAGKAEGEKLQAEADQLTKDLAEYNKRCSGITYDKEDREAIEKERGSK